MFKNVVTNNDLLQYMDTSDAWIQERFWNKKKEGMQTKMAKLPQPWVWKLQKIAIERAGITAQDVDFIIFATLSPDYYFPGCGVLVQQAMKMKEIGALDVKNQCSGFVYSLSVADQFIKTGMYKNILVIGSEKTFIRPRFLYQGEEMFGDFSDGAGAVLLQPAR